MQEHNGVSGTAFDYTFIHPMAIFAVSLGTRTMKEAGAIAPASFTAAIKRSSRHGSIHNFLFNASLPPWLVIAACRCVLLNDCSVCG